MILNDQYRKEFDVDLRDAWSRSLALRPDLNPATWADAKRWIAQGASPLSALGPIKYRVDRMPYCREPMISTVDPEVQVSAWMWASGMGKTEMGANVIGYSIEHAPTNQFIVYPKEDSAEKFGRDVLQRMIDSSPDVARCVVPSGGRKAGNTINYKEYIGGSAYVTAAGSPSNFRGPRAGMVMCDEIDAFPSSVGREGDPIGLAFKRAEGFPDSIKILSGTPTLKGHSTIEYWLDVMSDKRMWFVPCRRCDRLQVLRWRHRADIKELHSIVDWPSQGKARHEKAVVLCGHCSASHDDRQRLQMVFDGAWKPTQPFNGIRGYWLNGINSTLPAEKGFKTKLHQFAVDAHNAANSVNRKETLKVWVNTFLAETYQEESDIKQEWETMFKRREEYPCKK